MTPHKEIPDDRKLLRDLSRTLNVRIEEVPKALERMKKETDDNERKVRELERS